MLATGSAFAAHHLRHERQLSDSNAGAARDPMGVYIDGREIGRDPDPATREEPYKERGGCVAASFSFLTRKSARKEQVVLAADSRQGRK